MWSRVAHVAVPKYQCCVGLDHLKSVLALSRLRHLQGIQVSCLYFSSRDAYDLLCSFVGEVSVSRQSLDCVRLLLRTRAGDVVDGKGIELVKDGS